MRKRAAILGISTLVALSLSAIATPNLSFAKDSHTPRVVELQAPAGVSVMPSDTSAVITFNSVASAASYTVRIFTARGEDTPAVVHSLFNSGASVSGLTAHTNYKVSVQAIGNGSTSISSEQSRKVSFTTLSTMSCANGGACNVGDTGPGGGTVFFTSTLGFNCGPTDTDTCHAMEAAPVNWYSPTATTDPGLRWADPAYQDQDVPGLTLYYPNPNLDPSAYGQGLLNSIAIRNQGNSATTAAVAALAYVDLGGHHDWYLPDSAELNLLCRYATNTPTLSPTCIGSATPLLGMSPDFGYGSSNAYAGGEWYQVFGTGSISGTGKADANYVRPIRSF